MVRADSILGVVAVIARPASTGLSAIVGRVCPISQSDDAAAVARLCDVETAPRRLRVPIVPGQVDVVGLASMDRLALGESIEFVGPLTLAYDGERERTVPAGATVRIVIDRLGPIVVDVDQTLLLASAARLFDVSSPVAASDPYTAEARNGN